MFVGVPLLAYMYIREYTWNVTPYNLAYIYIYSELYIHHRVSRVYLFFPLFNDAFVTSWVRGLEC